MLTDFEETQPVPPFGILETEWGFIVTDSTKKIAVTNPKTGKVLHGTRASAEAAVARLDVKYLGDK